jgi:NAD dependent epimerase/dehydratase
MNWQDRSVLVTGAGGFIASHLVEELIAAGANVSAFVRYTSKTEQGWLDDIPDRHRAAIRITRGDLRDAEAVEHAVKGHEYVFHLAALVGVPYSFVHPSDVISVNTVGTLNVLNAARVANVARIVVTSTSEVYGTAQYVPIDEMHPLQAQSPYAASKISADAIATSYHRAFGLPVAIIRPFNTYGPRQSARAVIPTIVTQALSGDTIRLGNLTATRDFTYVKDTVQGFLSVAAAGDEALGRPINVGSGHEISIGDLADLVIELTGSRARVEIDNQRLRPPTGEVERLCAANRLAAELIGWAPTTSIEDGLSNTIEWIRHSLPHFEPESYAI